MVSSALLGSCKGVLGGFQGVAMQLLDNPGWLLGFCYVVAEVPWWLQWFCYAVPRALGVKSASFI